MASRAVAAIGLSGSLRVRIVGDDEMAAAHQEFLDDPTTTDVLTFDMSDEQGLDADLMACLDEAERRSRELGHQRREELLLYIVHGVLHCAGFDDHEEHARRRMHHREDEVLRMIGVGPVF
ncbi:MAG TPA: rRNA maturation RNase YbeY, partial [Phycisphaerales bacterium]|nr:rRNA maturation RNase YbeY [Phycisphaerales bacterium]